jgi:hypothetical protein
VGIFDSLYVECPCGEKVEFQSKASEDKWCRSFTLADCPPEIAGDLLGDSEKCKCGRVITIRGTVNIYAETYTPNAAANMPVHRDSEPTSTGGE